MSLGFTKDTSLLSELSLIENLTFGNNLTLSGDLSVGNNVSVANNVTVTNDVTITEDLNVGSTSILGAVVASNFVCLGEILGSGGTANAPAFSFDDNDNSGMYFLNDRLGLSAGGDQFLDLNPANGRLTLTGDELVVSGASRFDGVTRIVSTTSSTSTTSGALQVTGGVGIAEDLYADNIYMPDGIRQSPNYSFTSAKDTGMYYSGGRLGLSVNEDTFIDMNIATGRVSIAKDELFVSDRLRVEGIANFNDDTNSTTTTSGALIVDGGVGIVKDVNIGGDLTVSGNQTTFYNAGDVTFLLEADTDNVTDTDNPEIWFKQDGGGVFARMGLNNWDGDASNENQLVISAGGGIANTNGIIFQAGGRGPNQALNIRPNFSTDDPSEVLRLKPTGNSCPVTFNITDTTNSTTDANGALIVAGGAGIGGNLNVGGDVDIAGDTSLDAVFLNDITEPATTDNFLYSISGDIKHNGEFVTKSYDDGDVTDISLSTSADEFSMGTQTSKQIKLNNGGNTDMVYGIVNISWTNKNSASGDVTLTDSGVGAPANGCLVPLIIGKYSGISISSQLTGIINIAGDIELYDGGTLLQASDFSSSGELSFSYFKI